MISFLIYSGSITVTLSRQNSIQESKYSSSKKSCSKSSLPSGITLKEFTPNSSTSCHFKEASKIAFTRCFVGNFFPFVIFGNGTSRPFSNAVVWIILSIRLSLNIRKAFLSKQKPYTYQLVHLKI